MIRLRLLTALALVVAGCSTGPGSSNIDLELFEFGINPSASTYSPGSVQFTATNTGEFPHTVVVTEASGEVVMASDLIQPGTSLTFSLDLVGGEYQITCRIVSEGPGGTLFDHFEQGMTTTITG